VDCHHSPWGAWGACSTTCGAGVKLRHRKLVQGSFGGERCSLTLDLEPVRGRAPCNLLAACPGACEVSPWLPWHTCEMACLRKSGGITVAFRSRTVVRQPTAQAGGRQCPALWQTKKCDRAKCERLRAEKQAGEAAVASLLMSPTAPPTPVPTPTPQLKRHQLGALKAELWYAAQAKKQHFALEQQKKTKALYAKKHSAEEQKSRRTAVPSTAVPTPRPTTAGPTAAPTTTTAPSSSPTPPAPTAAPTTNLALQSAQSSFLGRLNSVLPLPSSACPAGLCWLHGRCHLHGDCVQLLADRASGTSAPTSAPSASPTAPPTAPTSSPTPAPTAPPTPSPTQHPTLAPTGFPTSPTATPTASPTASPITEEEKALEVLDKERHDHAVAVAPYDPI
jgi:hypothetical protein